MNLKIDISTNSLYHKLSTKNDDSHISIRIPKKIHSELKFKTKVNGDTISEAILLGYSTYLKTTQGKLPPEMKTKLIAYKKLGEYLSKFGWSRSQIKYFRSKYLSDLLEDTREAEKEFAEQDKKALRQLTFSKKGQEILEKHKNKKNSKKGSVKS